jgi:mono/diheme cytochrome c family protein
VKGRLLIVATVLTCAAAGCSRQPDLAYVDSKDVQKLKTDMKDKIHSILTHYCGTPQAPKLLGNEQVPPAQLKHGAEVYSRYCIQCHGSTGDGNGVAAAYLIPKPRDYRPGTFKFTSTTYGSKPLREDLIRTVRRGIRGTSMPSFSLLPPKDQEAVVDYVLTLTRRGELESQLAEEVVFNETIDASQVPEMIKAILDRWKRARSQVVYPSTPMPEFTTAVIDKGKNAFLTVGCKQCHGDDGRGQLATNKALNDSWGNPTKAADLTSGMLRGGTEPLDIYRHIDAGINGTPMPSFRSALQKEPEMIWNLVGYVLRVADSRRKGTIFDSGLLEDGILQPLPGVKPLSVATAAQVSMQDRHRPAEIVRTFTKR